MNRREALRRRLDVAMSYRRLFLGDDGQLTEDARAFFRDLSDASEIAKSGALRNEAGAIDPVAHVYRDGKRVVWDHVQMRMGDDIAGLQHELAKLQED